ncbi:MAG: zf-TFIIB domain-containing protein [Planctomycetota bacterium]|nr:zf-TFIIB domain-containing protein [Planctomycetota bacterium]
MNCPACGRALTEKAVSGVTVDVCHGGCGGIWFDQLELAKVDDQEETAGEELLGIERDPSVKVDARARRRCPKCREIIMMRHFYGPKQNVEVDECGKCGGIWLDAGELAAIRSEYKSHEERHQAANGFAQSVFGKTMSPSASGGGPDDPHLAQFGRIIRFVWPKH